MSKHGYVVLLAGGGGERLWPLSRREKPKQLLSVGGKQSLLEAAVDRVAPVAEPDRIWVVTTSYYEKSVRELIGDRIGQFVIEPAARNTGPAVLLACLELYQKDPEAVITIVPTDHYVQPAPLFASALQQVYEYARSHDSIVLMGVRPTYPATGYGYIEYEKGLPPIVSVKRFHEKPSLATATQYLVSGNMLWNIGVFCASVRVMIDAFVQYAPEVYEAVVAYRKGLTRYQDIQSIAIDYAIIERCKNLQVMPVDLVWYDVGNLANFLSLRDRVNPVPTTQRIEIESKDNLVSVDQKLVALIGVQNMCIVQTGDVLLIAKRDDAEKVRLILHELKERNAQEYL